MEKILCFFGAGGQILISGILNLSAFGVQHSSKSLLMLSFSAMAAELEANSTAVSVSVSWFFGGGEGGGGFLFFILCGLFFLIFLLIFIFVLAIPPLEAMDWWKRKDFGWNLFRYREFWRDPFQKIGFWEMGSVGKRHWRVGWSSEEGGGEGLKEGRVWNLEFGFLL